MNYNQYKIAFVISLLVVLVLYIVPNLGMKIIDYSKTLELKEMKSIEEIKLENKLLKISLNPNEKFSLKEIEDKIYSKFNPQEFRVIYINKDKDIKELKKKVSFIIHEGIKTGKITNIKRKIEKLKIKDIKELNLEIDSSYLYLTLKTKNNYIAEKFRL